MLRITQLSLVALLGTLAAAASCAFPWDGDSPPNGCERTGYCPPPDADEDVSSDVVADRSSDDAAQENDAGIDGPRTDAADAEAGTGCTAPTTLLCSGTCVDPTRPAHCGTCGNVCEGPDSGMGAATCTGGICGLGCSAPTSLNCAGACVDPSEPAHCGACDNACSGPTAGTGAALCTLNSDGGGTCSVTCAGTTTQVCGSFCYAPDDPSHCGSCTNACPPPASGLGVAACNGTTPACDVTCNATAHKCSGNCFANSDEPSDTADPCIINETFGVFVSPSGSDTAAGTQLAPVATIGHAMDLAKAANKRVYACGSAGSYTESLTISAARDGVSVYGGLDCTTGPSQWAYNTAKVANLAPPTGYALQVTGLTTGVTFDDFAFVAAAASTNGASSIAIFDASSTGTLLLRRCDVQAGASMAGQPGTTPAPFAGSAPTGMAGTATAGGMPTPNGACSTSIGGAGGAPAPTPGSDGSDGQPGPSNKGTALGCFGSIGGGGGANGGPGIAGAGATTLATLSATGWSPTPGQPGQAGTVGEGGGGGGSTDTTGGGGAGGAGGCGGAGGGAGQAGGSSLAVLLFDASVDLESCSLVASTAGAGGAGATAGQTGQTGGTHGSFFVGSNACLGGKGGNGGSGGAGGGGAGGASAGVMWIGTAPTINGTSTPSAATLANVTIGSAGAAGTGGTPAAVAGVSGAVVQFP